MAETSEARSRVLWGGFCSLGGGGRERLRARHSIIGNTRHDQCRRVKLVKKEKSCISFRKCVWTFESALGSQGDGGRGAANARQSRLETTSRWCSHGRMYIAVRW